MDPIDQRARAARLAVENATAEVTPAPFTPRRSLVAPAVMAACLLVGGSVLATSVLGDSNDAEQKVATESEMAAAADDSTASGASEEAARIPTAEGSSASAASPEAMEEVAEEVAAPLDGEFFVLAVPPPGLSEPSIFAIPASEMSDGPFELKIDLYGTPGDDPFVNGDIGIMRADGMGAQSIDGEALTVAGREVLVERNEASGPDTPPGGPSIIVNWIDEQSGQAIGVATWTLEVAALLPLVEVLLDDPSATPAETAGGLALLSQNQSLGGGLGFLSGNGGQVMYQSDPSKVSGPDGFGMVVVSTGEAGENPEFASSWLFSGTVPKITELPDGVTVVEMTPEAGGGGTISVRVPHPTDDDRVVIVADAGSGGFDVDTMVAAARSVRLASESEVAEMAVASEGLGSVEGFAPAPMIEGEFADGDTLVVESGPGGFCIIKNGVETEEGCYDFIQPDTPEAFDLSSALSSRSKGGDILVMPFGEPEATANGSTRSVVASAELRFEDGSTVVADEFTVVGGMAEISGFFGWTVEVDRMPTEAVVLDSDGVKVRSYDLPDLQPEPGRKVTFIGMN